MELQHDTLIKYLRCEDYPLHVSLASENTTDGKSGMYVLVSLFDPPSLDPLSDVRTLTILKPLRRFGGQTERQLKESLVSYLGPETPSPDDRCFFPLLPHPVLDIIMGLSMNDTRLGLLMTVCKLFNSSCQRIFSAQFSKLSSDIRLLSSSRKVLFVLLLRCVTLFERNTPLHPNPLQRRLQLTLEGGNVAFISLSRLPASHTGRGIKCLSLQDLLSCFRFTMPNIKRYQWSDWSLQFWEGASFESKGIDEVRCREFLQDLLGRVRTISFHSEKVWSETAFLRLDRWQPAVPFLETLKSLFPEFTCPRTRRIKFCFGASKESWTRHSFSLVELCDWGVSLEPFFRWYLTTEKKLVYGTVRKLGQLLSTWSA